MIAGHLAHMLMSWVDMLMIGRVGVVSLAACGFANAVLAIPLLGGIGLMTAISVRASIAHGAKDEVAQRRSFFAGMFFSAIVGAVIVLILCVLACFLHLFGQPEEVIVEARLYFIICSVSMLPLMLAMSAKNFSEALAEPWLPFWIFIICVALNALLNWVFIYGNWGMPAMGLTGAGWATLIARVFTMVAVPWAVVALFRLRFHGDGIRKEIRKLFRLGTPVGVMLFAENLGFSAASIMMGWISVTALAAHQIVILCAGTAFMIPLGLSQAATVRIGHARGEGALKRCRPIVFGATALATAIMGVFMFVFIAWGDFIAQRFTKDGDLIALVAAGLVLIGLMAIFDGLQVIFSGVLRAFEDVHVPMLIMIAVYWLVTLPAAGWFAFGMRFGPQGIWSAIVLGIALVAIALGLRVRKRLYKIVGND